MPIEKHFNRLFFAAVLCLVHPVLCLYAERPVEENYKLTGTVIGTEPSFDYDTQAATYDVNTAANAFDGDFSTYVATYERSHAWVGLDLGTPHVITRVGWSPRNGGVGPSRVVLGLFEGSNREDFMDAIPLYMITEKGTIGVMSYADVHVSRGFRYVRWCAPADSRCNIAELEFYGHVGEGDDSQFYQLTNLPTLSYHTYDGIEPYDKVHELESEMCLIYDGGTRVQEYPILARERGNGSRYEAFLKRPYRIKFNDGKSHHMLRGSSLQSPAKSKKWTLIPNWREKSLMRNNIAFEMSRRLGLSYTPWIQNVDVIVNGEYKGNYQLCDQVTVDPHRVDIFEMASDDSEESNISGGYLLEITSPGGEQYHFSSDYGGIPVDVKYPDDNDITSEQFSYIRDAFNEMESRLWSADYMDADIGYRSRLDLDSFLRFFLVGEFAGNHDAMWSLYLYKERDDDLFHFGPVWDFDLSMDNDQRSYPANGKPEWLFNYGSAVTGIRSFVNRILSDPDATEMLSSIWAEMRESGAFSRDSLWAFVDSLGVVLDESQKLNFTRWDNLGTLLTLQQFAPGTYQGELDIIKDYLKERIRWIDNKLGYGTNPDVPVETDFAISTPEQLLDFADRVNDGYTNINATVTADLDFQGYRISPIGTQLNPYVGCFDGGGHIFSNLKIETGSNYAGLFGVVSGGATIKNFVLDKTCSISGAAFVGIIGGSNNGGTVTMECLGNEGSVTSTKQNAGGIFGCNMSGAATPIFINCYVTGPVKGGKESGQITGYGANGQAHNCYCSGTIEGYYYQDMSDAMLRGNPRSTNCYSTVPDKNATVIMLDQVASGELCYLLNQYLDANVWYQTLGEDDHPVLDSTHGVVMLADDGTYYNDPDRAKEIQNSGFANRDKGNAIYNLAGQQIVNSKLSNGKFPRGIHIIRMSDGTTKKVVMK
ncbi:MAG: CotH kinase family protein [Bacteroidaceae bacterium]|nr:CotH kinase family protein [Bacteroidaceae bacterium]